MASGEKKVSLMTYISSLPDGAKFYVVLADGSYGYTTKADIVAGVIGGGVVSVNGDLVDNTDPANPVIATTVRILNNYYPNSAGVLNISHGNTLIYGDRTIESYDWTSVPTGDLTADKRASVMVFVNERMDSDITFTVKTGAPEDGYIDGMEYKIYNASDFDINLVPDTGVTLIGALLTIPKGAICNVRFAQDSLNGYNLNTFVVTYEFGEIPSVIIDSVPTDGSANAVSSNGVFDALANKADLVSGLVPSSQLPSFVDDIIEGYKSGATFYEDSGHTISITGVQGKIFVDLTTGQSSKQYRWSGSVYIQITNGLIGSTDDVSEGGNLYFTAARVLATVLSGISFATGGAVVSTDSVLQAFGKIQKQINDLGSTYQALSAKDATGGYVGLTLFKINFKNAANTFTSFLTNVNTAARTYTFQDRNGIIADDTDVTDLKTLINNRVKFVIHDAVTSTGVNSTTTQTIIASYLIPANTFAANDVMNLISAKFKSNGSGGTVQYIICVNTINSLSGAVPITGISQNGATQVTSTIGPKTYTFTGGNLEGVFNTSGDAFGSSTTALNSTPLNPAANFYIIVTAQLGTSNLNNARQILLYITN